MSGQIGGNPHFNTAQVDIGSSATRIVSDNSRRLMLHVSNSGGETIFVGDSAVTPDTGFPILGMTTITVSTRDALYGVNASGNTTVGYFEEYW